MRVCVVVPVLNEELAIERTLCAISSQAHRDDIVVVDGGSNDLTAVIASRHATVVQSERGRSRQMNTGSGQTSAEVLVFVHADTIMPAGAISAIGACLKDPSVVGGRFKLRLSNRGWRYRIVECAINTRDRLFEGFTGDQAIFVRRDVFESMGGYRDIPLMEDLDFGKRMGRRGKIARLPLYVVTSARRWENNGVVRTVLLMWLLKIMYTFGCPPQRLQRLYGDAR
jgi:rSAM/selenodomain-associated transferase 2